MLTILLPALSLGFLGSFHCIGMCGPIALTLPVQHLTGAKKLAGILLYNVGRITAYAVLGMIFGWLGQQFYLGGLQQWLSITVGSLLLLMVLLNYVVGKRIQGTHLLNGFTTRIKTILGGLLRQQRFRTLYAIGFFNGLLPCGLVYLGIAGSVATGDVEKGILFMSAFGAGTLPAMMAVTYFSNLISLSVRNKMRNMIPYVIGIMGILLIMRGLNLGIPYISPYMSAHSEKVVERCCHP
jgi:sulfite exporter TauE/SafE